MGLLHQPRQNRHPSGMAGQKPHHDRPLATRGGGNNSDGTGAFNDYYEGRHADYDGHDGNHTSDNVTGSTIGGGSNPTDGGMIHSGKFKGKA
jgi:hypothetical protein